MSANPTELVVAAETQAPVRVHGKRDDAWILPFFVVLVSALAFFVLQMAQYTSLLG